jgi:hypothetical protein
MNSHTGQPIVLMFGHVIFLDGICGYQTSVDTILRKQSTIGISQGNSCTYIRDLNGGNLYGSICTASGSYRFRHIGGQNPVIVPEKKKKKWSKIHHISLSVEN